MDLWYLVTKFIWVKTGFETEFEARYNRIHTFDSVWYFLNRFQMWVSVASEADFSKAVNWSEI